MLATGTAVIAKAEKAFGSAVRPCKTAAVISVRSNVASSVSGFASRRRIPVAAGGPRTMTALRAGCTPEDVAVSAGPFRGASAQRAPIAIGAVERRGVRRQAVREWLERGLPRRREEDAARHGVLVSDGDRGEQRAAALAAGDGEELVPSRLRRRDVEHSWRE